MTAKGTLILHRSRAPGEASESSDSGQLDLKENEGCPTSDIGNSEHEKTKLLESQDGPKAKGTSYEQLYLAAGRYRIDDLRKLALGWILKCLGKADAVAFLFRTGYLFKELRGPVIRHIAKECHAEVAKKEILKEHKDRPEFCELLSELLDAYHELRK
ncbi:hypothetical protein CPC16_011738 [Podila verticillata]|nr:hypothetical protein CPC16_011738 [Podila verticillata]